MNYNLKAYDEERLLNLNVCDFLSLLDECRHDDYFASDFDFVFDYLETLFMRAQAQPEKAFLLGKVLERWLKLPDRERRRFWREARKTLIVRKEREALPAEKALVEDVLKSRGVDVQNAGQYDEELMIPEGVRIQFAGSRVAVTGASARAERKDFKLAIEKAGGIFTDSVSSTTDYLVVCSKKSKGWKFSNFGRKVQSAAGWGVCLVREDDFFASLNEVGCSPV